jgi:hypothetical protein
MNGEQAQLFHFWMWWKFQSYIVNNRLFIVCKLMNFPFWMFVSQIWIFARFFKVLGIPWVVHLRSPLGVLGVGVVMGGGVYKEAHENNKK